MPILDLLNRVPTPRPSNDELLPTQVQGHSWGARFVKIVVVVSLGVVFVFSHE